MQDKEISILIVEDNLVVQRYLKAAVESHDAYKIIDVIDNGIDAIAKAIEYEPDVILLDLFLPGKDGIEVIEEVMSVAPCPIIVISAELDRKDRDLSFEAQKSGAVDIMPKPDGMSEERFFEFSKKLCRTIRIMSEVKVTTRKVKKRISAPDLPSVSENGFGLVVIGSSTGGPAALHQLLKKIAGLDINYSILVAQHIASGFAETFRDWLSSSGIRVVIPENFEKPEPGTAYIAADDRHLVMGEDKCLYQVDNPGARYSPSVDMLFQSVANNYDGRVLALVLTGMGQDGSTGIIDLYDKGAMTIAEDEKSAIIFGMPNAAIVTGAIHKVMPLDDITEYIYLETCQHLEAC